MFVYVCNPAAGRGRTLRRMGVLAQQAAHLGLEGEVWTTEGPGHATTLARRAAAAGAAAVIAVGGDGTAHEVANGLLSCGHLNDPNTRPALGVVPLGSGDDLARAIGVPRRWPESLEALHRAVARTIDVGRAAPTGREARYFVESAGTGFDAYVGSLMARERLFRGPLRYAKGVITGLWSFENTPVRLALDGVTEEVTALVVTVTNGEYYGGGMKITPGAVQDDGLLDVAVIGDIGKLDTLLTFPKIYTGRHVSHPKVSIRRARQVEVVPLVPREDQPLLVHADGELIGRAPVRFHVVPAALRVLVPPARA